MTMPDTPQSPHTNTANAGGEAQSTILQDLDKLFDTQYPLRGGRTITIPGTRNSTDLAHPIYIGIRNALADFILERIQAAQTEARQKLMTEIRAEAYRRSRFELQAHPKGVLIDPNKIKWDVFEKYFAGIIGMPELASLNPNGEKNE